MARFTHIKLVLPAENRTSLINYVALDSYPRIHKLDVQYIFHGLSNIDIKESLTEDPYGDIAANEY